MNCLRCDTPMEERPSGNVRLDVCPSCDGKWFDLGELDAWALARGTLKTTQLRIRPHEDGGSPCPSCATGTLGWGVRSGVRYDACPACRGLFLDRRAQADLRDVARIRPATRDSTRSTSMAAALGGEVAFFGAEALFEGILGALFD